MQLGGLRQPDSHLLVFVRARACCTLFLGLVALRCAAQPAACLWVCVCVLRLVLGAAFSRAAPLIVLGVFVRAVFLRPGLFAIRRAALLFVFRLCAFVA